MTPKARFLENKPTATWLIKVFSDDRFRAATEVAMLEMVAKLAEPPLPEGKVVVEPRTQFYRLAGAQQYLRTLLALGESQEKWTIQPPADNLDHQA